jgi:ribosomal protein L32
MIYAIIDRKLLKAANFKEMVRLLNDISFDEVCNKKDYMFNVAERVRKLYKIYIENYKYEGFVRALDKLTIINLLKCSDCDAFFLDNTSDEYYCAKGIIKDFNKNRADCMFMINKLIKKANTEIIS